MIKLIFLKLCNSEKVHWEQGELILVSVCKSVYACQNFTINQHVIMLIYN